MKRDLQFILFALFNILIGACQNNREVTEDKEIKNEVIEIHDEIMPEMQTVFNLKKSLNQRLDSLNNINIGKENPLKSEFEAAIQELNEANQDMMQWMRNFNPKFESDQENERIAYYKTEKEKILKVKSKFTEAIEKAEMTLAKVE
jgi:hypothetical protein